MHSSLSNGPDTNILFYHFSHRVFLLTFFRVYRIQKELSVSRAFGDKDFKYPYCKEIWETGPCTADLLSAVPEIVSIRLVEADEFLIIACDGL